MPIGSPGDEPARSVRDLGLPARAVTVLTRAGILSAVLVATSVTALLRLLG